MADIIVNVIISPQNQYLFNPPLQAATSCFE